MTRAKAKFPEVVFLRRADQTGYGFFFRSEEDFRQAADSFTKPILRSFDGEPLPGQPEPDEHLRTAIAAFLAQAFENAIPAEVGPEGVSRCAAACVRAVFAGPVPRVVVLARKDGRVSVQPGIEFMRQPGHPLAVVVDADTHGGIARFFSTADEFRKVGESAATPMCWLPQIVYRLYARTPSVMVGRPCHDDASAKSRVECRGITFGLTAPFEERRPLL